MNIYEPAEDSFLLLKHVPAYAKGKVLDMGAGSGIIAKEAAKFAREVVAVDINPKAIEKIQHANTRNLSAKLSNLFSHIKGSFDVIFFNPPYLPDDPRAADIALDGGKHGYEVIERFLCSAKDHLKNDGKILLLFSSQSKKPKVEEFIRSNGYHFREIDRRNIEFETLYVYEISLGPIIRIPRSNKIKDIHLLAKGHRGLIFKGVQKKKTVAIKLQREDSPAMGTVHREAEMLKVLNKKGIGPHLLSEGRDFFVYEFVEGKFLMDYLQGASKEKVLWVIREVLDQMRLLDNLNLNKEEMHHPYKHIIIGDSKVTLIDFERCKKTPDPKNVTQFLQCITSFALVPLLGEKDISIDIPSIKKMAAAYKSRHAEGEYKKIKNLFISP